jgi:nucleotide-binding universal stress UspA family protein
MFNHILIPTDGSDLSRKALLYAVEIARESKAKVTALTVRPAYVIGSMDMIGVVGGQDEFEAETRRYAEYALTQAKMAGEAASVPVETIQDVADQPYRAIIECANANGCDLIVMASHGRRGVSAMILGSETSKVLTHSHIPVLVFR